MCEMGWSRLVCSDKQPPLSFTTTKVYFALAKSSRLCSRWPSLGDTGRWTLYHLEHHWSPHRKEFDKWCSGPGGLLSERGTSTHVSLSRACHGGHASFQEGREVIYQVPGRGAMDTLVASIKGIEILGCKTEHLAVSVGRTWEFLNSGS